MHLNLYLANVWKRLYRLVRHPNTRLVTGLFSVSAILHILPFLVYGQAPLGYDTGFYRRYLIEPSHAFLNAPVPGLGYDAPGTRILLDLLRLTHLPPDFLLYGSYIVLSSLLPCLLFVLMRSRFDRRVASIAGIFLAVSAVAYHAYWYMLFKNALGLCLILLAYIGFERRAGAWLFLLDLAIATSHKTSAIIYVLSLGVLFVISPGRRCEFLLHGLVTGTILIALNLPTIREIATVSPTALFLDWPSFVILALPYLVLMLCGFPFMRRFEPRTLFAFAAASFVFPIARLPFYERIFVFCDVALAAFAAFGLEYMLRHALRNRQLEWRGMAAFVFVCVTTGLMLGNVWNQFNTLRPLVADTMLQEITTVGMRVPPGATILTTSNEAPWYEGWTTAHIAAPGLLHDHHNLEQWEAFWGATTDEERIAFLSEFPSPLYVSTFDDLGSLVGSAPLTCLQEITGHLWYDACIR